MSAIHFFVSFVTLVVLAAWFIHWCRTLYWTAYCRHLMTRGKEHEEAAIEVLKVTLALDGHRLPRRVRDAVVAWLAERDHV